jgi:4-hydroxybenzoate polyprenyltransferase
VAGSFIFYSNLFIAFCALVCIQGRLHLFRLPHPPVLVYALYGASVIIIYNLHYFYTPANLQHPRRQWFWRHRVGIHTVTGIAVVLFAAALFQLSPAQWLVTAAIGVAGILYSVPLPGLHKSLNQFGIVKIVLLSTCWTAFTTVLPLMGQVVADRFFYLVLAETWVFFFILCLLFDSRDRLADEQRGVHTLPVLLGHRHTFRLVALLTMLLLLLNSLHLLWGHGLATGNGFILSTLLTGWMATLCYRQPNEWIWLAGVDALLLLQGLLLVVS